jgi:hypothetical protein
MMLQRPTRFFVYNSRICVIVRDSVGTCGNGEELWGSINAGNFLTSCKVDWLASQEGLYSME